MTRYIIKGTYQSGIHAGKSFYLIRGGYFVDPEGAVLISDTYSLSTCKAICTKKAKDNLWHHEIEKLEREWCKKEGEPQFLKYPIYELQSFEPFAIEYAE